MSEILGTGIAFPLQLARRADLALVENLTDVEQAICVILGTAPGERAMRPEFGCKVHDFAFDTIDAALVGRVETEVRRALARWEPRIEVRTIDFDLSAINDGVLIVNVVYRIRATNQARNLVYPFYAIPEEESE